MSTGHDDSCRGTRREFTKALAVAAALPLVGGVPSARADEPAKPKPPSTAESLAEMIRSRYGKHLTEEQLKRVRSQVERNLRSGAALRRPPLRNGEEPDSVFLADM